MRANHEAEAVLADLLAAGAIPVLEAGRLRIEGPRSAVTPARREAMSVCQEADPDGWPCLTPRVCADCKAELPVGQRYLCEACAEAGLRRVSS